MFSWKPTQVFDGKEQHEPHLFLLPGEEIQQTTGDAEVCQ